MAGFGLTYHCNGSAKKLKGTDRVSVDGYLDQYLHLKFRGEMMFEMQGTEPSWRGAVYS